jgi:chorismate synthase
MILRFLTAGESHGPQLTGILEGMVAGLPLSADIINAELARRQKGYGSGDRMKLEKDGARITGGVMNGQTTGGPIALHITNRNYEQQWAGQDIEPMTIPRPGHGDLNGAIKYGYGDLRLALERASARETAIRVAIGAVCKAFLREFGVRVGGYVAQIGPVKADLTDIVYEDRFEKADRSDMRCPDPAAADQMRALVEETREAGDTLGGIFEIIALGLPTGLGSHVQWDRRLTGRVLAMMGSIQAIKGAEVGPAFENAARHGTDVHDAIHRGAGGCLYRETNRAGGLEAGMTNGNPLVVRAAMKPISTTLTGIPSVDLATGEASSTEYERSDVLAIQRAVVIGEAMIAYLMADEMLRKLGGDTLPECKQRHAALKRAHLDDLEMDNVEWRFGYE